MNSNEMQIGRLQIIKMDEWEFHCGQFPVGWKNPHMNLKPFWWIRVGKIEFRWWL